jgi:hypothetical protein
VSEDNEMQCAVDGVIGPAMVLLPTPPFADDTATIFDTFGIFRLVGRPRWALGKDGGAPFRGRPWPVRWALEDVNGNHIPADSHGQDTLK